MVQIANRSRIKSHNIRLDDQLEYVLAVKTCLFIEHFAVFILLNLKAICSHLYYIQIMLLCLMLFQAQTFLKSPTLHSCNEWICFWGLLFWFFFVCFFKLTFKQTKALSTGGCQNLNRNVLKFQKLSKEWGKNVLKFFSHISILSTRRPCSMQSACGRMCALSVSTCVCLSHSLSVIYCSSNTLSLSVCCSTAMVK